MQDNVADRILYIVDILGIIVQKLSPLALTQFASISKKLINLRPPKYYVIKDAVRQGRDNIVSRLPKHNLLSIPKCLPIGNNKYPSDYLDTIINSNLETTETLNHIYVFETLCLEAVYYKHDKILECILQTSYLNYISPQIMHNILQRLRKYTYYNDNDNICNILDKFMV